MHEKKSPTSRVHMKTRFHDENEFLQFLAETLPECSWGSVTPLPKVWWCLDSLITQKCQFFSNSSLKCNFKHSTLKTCFLCRICRLLSFMMSMQVCLLTLILNVHKINQKWRWNSQFPSEIASRTPYLSLASASIHFRGFNHLQTRPKCMQMMQQVILLSPCSPSSTH